MRAASQARSARPHEDEAGSFLVELVVGLAIIVAVLFAVITTTLQQQNLRRLDEETSLALRACRNQLEDLRALSSAELAASDGRGFDVGSLADGPGGLRARPGDADGLPGVISVTLDKSFNGVSLFLIRVRVLWSGARGDQDVELKSLFSERKVG